MVYLPSEVIMNIISFLGGEKYNIKVEKESTISKILKQKNDRIRDIMINDVAKILAQKTHIFMNIKYEENYKKVQSGIKKLSVETISFRLYHPIERYYTFEISIEPKRTTKIQNLHTSVYIKQKSDLTRCVCDMYYNKKSTINFLDELEFIFSRYIIDNILE